MRESVYGSLFKRLADLLPSLTSSPVGATFYAPPRRPQDLAVCCQVTAAEGAMRTIEVTQDKTLGAENTPAFRLAFRIDGSAELAELMAVEDGSRTGTVYTGGGAINPRRAQLNLYALNWLSFMLNLNMTFRAVEPSMAVL